MGMHLETRTSCFRGTGNHFERWLPKNFGVAAGVISQFRRPCRIMDEEKKRFSVGRQVNHPILVTKCHEETVRPEHTFANAKVLSNDLIHLRANSRFAHCFRHQSLTKRRADLTSQVTASRRLLDECFPKENQTKLGKGRLRFVHNPVLYQPRSLSLVVYL